MQEKDALLIGRVVLISVGVGAICLFLKKVDSF